MPNFFRKFSFKSRSGFTLVELMISISIIAVLSSIGLVLYKNSQITARDGKRKQDLKALSVAVELFYQDNKRYPCSGNGHQTLLTSGNGSFTDSSFCPGGSNTSISPTYINQIPKDPLSTGSYVYTYWSSSNTWGTQACSTKDAILIAHLENTNDKDRAGNNSTWTVCGNLNVSTTWGTDAYVIKLP